MSEIERLEAIVTYKEYEHQTYYHVVLPHTSRSGDGTSALLSGGPISRMHENGFVVKSVESNVDAGDDVLDVLEHRHHPTADMYMSVEFEYVGSDHKLLQLCQNS